MTTGWGGQHVGQRWHAALLPQVMDLLDSAKLLDVTGLRRDGRGDECRSFCHGVEPVRRQELGDAFVVPDRRGEPADGEREGVNALVEEEVAAIGRVRLVLEPEHVVGTEAIGEVGDGRWQQAGVTKPFAIDHEASAGPPVGQGRRGDAVVPAPGFEGAIEHGREFLDAVAVASRSIGDERQPMRLDDPEPGASRPGRKGSDGLVAV